MYIFILGRLRRELDKMTLKETESNFLSNSLEVLIFYDPVTPRPEEGRVLSHFLNSVFYPRKSRILAKSPKGDTKRLFQNHGNIIRNSSTKFPQL